MEGIFSGKLFNKGTNPNKIGVTYGPTAHRQQRHPVDKLLDAVNGKDKLQYTANGAVNIPPKK